MLKKGSLVRLVHNIGRNGEPFRAVTVGKLYRLEKDTEKAARWYDHNGKKLPEHVEDYLAFIRRDDGQLINYWLSRFVPAKHPGVFETGDRVRILDREELEKWIVNDDVVPIEGTNEFAYNPGLAEEMLQYAGKEYIVGFFNADEHRAVALYEEGDDLKARNYVGVNEWAWSKGWIRHVEADYKPVVPFEVGMQVYVKGKGNEGVAPRWVPEQDKAIGKKKTIREVHKTHVVLSDGLSYQFVSIEKWNQEKHGVKKGKSLRAIIAQARKQANPTGLCSFTFIQPGDNKSPDPKIAAHMGAPCHAGLNNVKYAIKGATKGALALIEHIGYKQKSFKNDKDKKAFVKYVDYIVNRSPWRSAFIPKQGRNCIKTGADLNVNVSANVIAGGCIVLRMSHEFQLAPAFGHFKKLGYDDHVAFLLGWSFGLPEKQGYYINSMTSGHAAIGGSDISPAALLSFFRNGYDEKEIKPESPWGAGNKSYQVIDPVARTKVDPKVSKFDYITWRALVNAKCPTVDIGRGFDVKKIVTHDKVEAFAELIKKELEA